MVTEEQLKKFFNYLDSKNEGYLTFNDFARWAIKFTDQFKWKKVREFFNVYSHDKKTLDRHDIHLFLDEISKTYKFPKPSVEELTLFFDKIDKDHNGKITYKEFHDWIENLEKGFKKEFNLRHLFDIFDEDGNGSLDEEEFNHFLDYLEKIYHIPLSSEMRENLLARIDFNKNGFVSFDDFENFYKLFVVKIK